MGPLLHKLWNDPDYLVKALTMLIGFVAVLLPLLPLGEFGAFGYWLGKLALPVVIALGATARGSGLTHDEAAKLRALLPTQVQMDKATDP